MKKERIRKILNDLQSLRVLSTAQAEERYHASKATIRRNFNELAASGLALRTHGGIRFLEQGVPSVPYGLREEWNTEEKRAIAQEAVKYIRDSHSVMVYGGSTTEHLGLYLSKGRIVTNLPDLCRILRMRFPTGDGPQVILTGGQFNFRTGNLEGPALRRSLDNYECDAGIASGSRLPSCLKNPRCGSFLPTIPSSDEKGSAAPCRGTKSTSSSRHSPRKTMPSSSRHNPRE